MNKKQENIDDALLLKVIEGRANDMEITVFQKWQNESQENSELFAEMKKVYQLSTFDKHSTKANWDVVVNKVRTGYNVPDFIELAQSQKKRKIVQLNVLLRVAAIIVLFIGMIFLFKSIDFNDEQLIVSGSELKNNEAYQLADGSLVYLQGNSEISFQESFGSKNRELNLKGQAFFEVRKNKELPFVIVTNNTKTKVLGTSFNVYSDSLGEVKVSVVSGVVRFYSNEKNSVKLHPHEQGIYNPITAQIKKADVKNQNFMAWKTGNIVFNDTPIDEAFDVLSRHYTKRFLYKSTENEIPVINTAFNKQPLEAVLEELNLLLDTKTVIKNDTIVFEFNN